MTVWIASIASDDLISLNSRILPVGRLNFWLAHAEEVARQHFGDIILMTDTRELSTTCELQTMFVFGFS